LFVLNNPAFDDRSETGGGMCGKIRIPVGVPIKTSGCLTDLQDNR